MAYRNIKDAAADLERLLGPLLNPLDRWGRPITSAAERLLMQARDVGEPMSASSNSSNSHARQPAGPAGEPKRHYVVTCEGPATFSAVGPGQATADGALYSETNPYSIRGGTDGTIAVQNGFLGLSKQQLRQYGDQIFVMPQDSDLAYRTGGPQGPYTVSDLGDKYIQNDPDVRFDIYRWNSLENAKRFGKKKFKARVAFPLESGAQCPPGWNVTE